MNGGRDGDLFAFQEVAVNPEGSCFACDKEAKSINISDGRENRK